MSIEEALVALMKRGKKLHTRVAEAVFSVDLAASRNAMAPWFDANVSLDVLCHICSGSVTTVEKYLACIERKQLNTHVVNALIRDVLPSGACKTLDEMEQALLSRRTTIADVLSVDARPTDMHLWHQQIPDGASPWWRVVWCRVNLARSLGKYLDAHKLANKFTREKIQRFIDAHATCARALDANPLVDGAELARLYAHGAGRSYYDEDRNLIVMERRQFQTKPTPLQLLSGTQDSIWRVEEMAFALESGQYNAPACVWEQALELPCMGQAAVDRPDLYKLAYASLCIQHQCRLGATTAHYHYFLAFTDLFSQPRVDDAYLLEPLTQNATLTRWQTLYPHDTRAFTADDLPNLFHVLMAIPLHDQPNPNTFFISKYLQKCLPFSGQRRSLIWNTVDEIRRSGAFWALFSRVMWCMLVNAYPSDKYAFDLRYVLRAHQLTGDRDLMLKTLEGDRGKEMTNGSWVVLCAFRLWMFHMVGDNRYYLECATACVPDFCNIHTAAREMAAVIRSGNIYPEDAFSMARAALSGKNNGAQTTVSVNRYKKNSCAGTLLKIFDTALEKDIYAVLRTITQDYEALLAIREDHARVARDFGPTQQTHFREYFRQRVTRETVDSALEWARDWIAQLSTQPEEKAQKEAILNILLQMPPHDRLTARGFSILMLPRCGGVDERSVHTLCSLVRVYSQKKAMPKDYAAKNGSFQIAHVKVIAWYLNVVCLLNNVVLYPLSSDTVRATDRAMWKRRFEECDPVPDSFAYKVYVSLCCQSVKTLRGTDNYGHMHIAYNTDARAFVCSKNDKKTAPQKRRERRKNAAKRKKENDEDDDDEDDEDEEEEDDAQMLNLDTVVDMVVRGDATNDNRYQRKDFHFIPCDRQPVLEIDLRGYMLYFKRRFYVHCPECGALFRFERRLYHGESFSCNECAEKNLERVRVTQCVLCREPAPPDCILTMEREQVYFCKPHYKIAKSRVNRLSRTDLFDYVVRVERKKKQQGHQKSRY